LALSDSALLNVSRVLETGQSQFFTPPADPGFYLTRAKILNRSEFFYRFRDLPAQTAALGVCEDGLPVLFDLVNPDGGPLLVVGEDPAANSSLLQFMVQSAVTLNSPAEVRYAAICNRPAEWDSLAGIRDSTQHCLGTYGNYDRAAEKAIQRIASIAEQRQTGRQAGPAILLVLDDLAAVQEMDFEARISLEWLLTNGPASQIWPVASLPPQKTTDVAPWLVHFKTLVSGWMPVASQDTLALEPGLDASRLSPGRQFAAWAHQSWLKFWLPQD
jgi:hypothetical protein